MWKGIPYQRARISSLKHRAKELKVEKISIRGKWVGTEKGKKEHNYEKE